MLGFEITRDAGELDKSEIGVFVETVGERVGENHVVGGRWSLMDFESTEHLFESFR